MFDDLKSGSALAALVCIGVGSMAGGASALPTSPQAQQQQQTI
jgi:hypothetical protein